MPRIHVTLRDGGQLCVQGQAAQSLKDALKGAGIAEVLGLCGGNASCGTCHVHIAEDWMERLPTIQPNEDEILTFSDWRRPNSRLSCQIPFTEALDGIALTIAPED